jgi:hypothetical protein
MESAAVMDRLRAAFEDQNLAAVSILLADDVRWGDDDNPDKCRNRAQVLRTLSQVLGERDVSADITEMVQGVPGNPLRARRPLVPRRGRGDLPRLLPARRSDR